MTKSISLSCTEGNSNKVYHATIERSGDKFTVNFAYGKRGNALTNGTKTTTPVDIESANKIFEKLVKEKTAKGYSIEGGTISPINTVSEKVDTGMHAQLLNPIEEEQALKLIEDDRYLAQEKYDGRRMQIRKIGEQLTCANRKGQSIPIPNEFEHLRYVPYDFIIDGENMGSYFAAFDLLSIKGVDINKQRTDQRIEILYNLVEDMESVICVKTMLGTAGKKLLHDTLVKTKKEGIVFKLKSAPYTPGRPNSGGSQLKFKFYATASFIVKRVNTQRSVLLALYDENGKSVEAGNVTIPINHEVPSELDIVEVKYLYAFKESGSVYQPSYLGKRDDVDAKECSTTQLKYKPTSED